MKDNIISNLYKKYQSAVPSPLHQSLLVGGLTVPVMYLANKFMYNRLKRLAQDPRAAMLAGLTPREAQQSLQEMENSTFNKHVVPWLAGALAFSASAAPNVNFDAPYWGLTEWYPKNKQEGETKTAALKKYASLWGDEAYQPTFDFNTPVLQRTAVDLFANNPYIQEQNYQRNLGTSIIMGAPAYGGQTTLGNIYDSAVNKFDKKLSLSGLAGSAIKGTIAGGLAGMFTDALGAVVGMPDPLRRSIANTVGFAKAMITILS